MDVGKTLYASWESIPLINKVNNAASALRFMISWTVHQIGSDLKELRGQGGVT